MNFRWVMALAAAAAVGTATAETSETLTLATYNIHSGIPAGFNQGTYFPSAQDARNIADVLTTTGASIIALQEVRNLSPAPPNHKPIPTPPNLPLLIAGYLDMNYAFGSSLDAGFPMKENREYAEWGNAARWTNNGKAHGEYGNALLTSFTLKEPSVMKLPLGDAAAQAKENGDEPRTALRAEVSGVPGLGDVVVYSTHFQHNNGQTRLAQMKALLESAKADAAKCPVLLMGDFNHTPHPGEPDLLGLVKEAGFHDLAAEYSAETGKPLQATIDMGIRIDYVFSSRKLKVTDVRVLETKVSDHYALAITAAAQE